MSGQLFSYLAEAASFHPAFSHLAAHTSLNIIITNPSAVFVYAVYPSLLFLSPHLSLTTLISHQSHFFTYTVSGSEIFPVSRHIESPRTLWHISSACGGSPFNQRLGRLFHDPLMHIQLFSGSPGNSLFHSRQPPINLFFCSALSLQHQSRGGQCQGSPECQIGCVTGLRFFCGQSGCRCGSGCLSGAAAGPSFC